MRPEPPFIGAGPRPASVPGLPPFPPRPAETMPAAEPAPSEPDGFWGQFLQEVLETVLLGVVLFVALRAVIQSTRVISTSMFPTLHEGQHLLVNKLSYKLGDPHRGDIAVFHSPQDEELILIKRVIGLPGEEISIIANQVYVDGQTLPEPYLPVQQSPAVWGPYVLGADQYLMLGDNRNNSNDSRFFGSVSRSAIIGKAWFSLWPPGQLAAGGFSPGSTPPGQTAPTALLSQHDLDRLSSWLHDLRLTPQETR